ncbi:MAG TPA: 50S ribosomal protein L24 [Candidatus Nanoarchaeia archaeon]|nr:50S ribosomal protein L24 [Candidatus Nanoarchaeia archaeon]
MTQKKFSTAWKASTQPRKQRKYNHAAPLHLKQKYLHVHVTPELRKKYGIRNARVRKGDKVKILRGQFAQKEGKVERVEIKRTRLFITGAEIIKKDGAKVPYPIHPSNILIMELDLGDKKRKAKLESNSPTSPRRSEVTP